jgi:hypothetical protein
MNWRKFLLIGVGWGLGTAAGLAAIIGCFIWYQSRPEPLKNWNTTAILSSDAAPTFGSGDDGNKVTFTYTLQNTTDADYEIGTDTEVRITFKNTDGSLTEPLPKEVAALRRPVFVPAKQKAMTRLSIVFGKVPQKSAHETDDQYHEKLRGFLIEEMGDTGFVIFDERNRYQINLPAVRKEKQ